MMISWRPISSLRVVPSQVANFLVEADVYPGTNNAWSDWTKMNAGGARQEDIMLPPGRDAPGCANGIRMLHFRTGYDHHFNEKMYFHDWFKFGYACLSDPVGVIHWDDQVDYGATDFDADKIFNISCLDQPDEQYNNEVIRGVEIRRFETKGVDLGGKGTMAYQVRDEIYMRAICDFGHDFSPAAWGSWTGKPYGAWKETQGGYCGADRKGNRLRETNLKKIEVQYYLDATKNGQSFNMRFQCGHRTTRKKRPAVKRDPGHH